MKTAACSPSLRDDHRSVRVYLPPSYDSPEGRGGRYPVVYFLHGWPGGNGNWTGERHATETLDSLIARERIPEVIGVFPSAEGNGLFGRSMYVNTWDGASRMEDFIVRDLVAWTDARFRTRGAARARAVIGLSEGGSAAINLAFKHPDVFGACASHSGMFHLTRGMGEKRILGPDSVAARILEENSPLLYLGRVAPRLRGMSIYFDTGVEDRDELADGRELDRRLSALGLAHTYREYPGDHRWEYWKRHLHDSLIAVTSRMR